MAAFSYQCHPFLVDSALLFPNNNTPIKPSPSPFMDPHQPLLPPSQTLQETPFGVTNYHETSPVCQPSKITVSDNEPSSVTKNQSPETSMVVDKLETGEQVTQKMITPVQRKKRNRNRSSMNSPKSTKDTTIDGRNKKQKKNNGGGGLKDEEKGKAEKKSSEEPPTGYIHVRARRGQATDSHSLAERVRREKISERMKTLQKLVPGCDKVTGKALMLDEIINYVQSLQNQVEFLSMKLASVNPMFYDFTMDLDSLMVRPEKLNSNIMAPVLPTLSHCSPNEATPFVDTTTVTAAAAAAVDAARNFPRANDYLLDNSTAYLLHGQRPNVFSEDNINQFWDVEDQRQKLLSPYGFSNNLCSFH